MDLKVELVGDEIVVTKAPAMLAYRKVGDEPRLVLTRSNLPPMSLASASEFRARALQSAVAKARELGWIV